MKKYVAIAPILLLAISTWAQTDPVKVVFDVTSGDAATHAATLRHVKFMAETYADAEFEVVVYGGALPMVLQEHSSVAGDILEFEGHERVSFVVCEGTMKRYETEKSQLIPGVSTVPDGILEIVIKQGEGWGYIKEAHK
ncbi:hypothetical protein [Negadavirga shengliensis]|uniref:Intracellular sulfur oxidation protein, DsrE/DsrF family n=1 Tax=Negadavirga shengliensis TaxID=1389218 RepID=A0ABV9T2G4_9BACT